jgi:hypothetical protein
MTLTRFVAKSDAEQKQRKNNAGNRQQAAPLVAKSVIEVLNHLVQ